MSVWGNQKTKHVFASEPDFPHFTQGRELQTLHNLRRLFVQDLATQIKKVKKKTSCNVSRCAAFVCDLISISVYHVSSWYPNHNI